MTLLRMRGPKRLVTSIEINAAHTHINTSRQMTVSALHQLELTDGRRLTLLDDRGWSSSGPEDIWSSTSLDHLADTARTVVGPDEPPAGRSPDEEAALHWAHLAAVAQAHGVHIEPSDLAALPHDVETSREIQARLARPTPAS